MKTWDSRTCSLWTLRSGHAGFQQHRLCRRADWHQSNGGTYNWTITKGGAQVSFSPNSSLASTSTSTNSVAVYSAGASKTPTDVTVQLSWVSPSFGTIPSSTSFGVDAPYSLVSGGRTSNYSVALCYTFNTTRPTQGNNGWQSDVPYSAVSVFKRSISNMDFNESLGGVTAVYKGENWRWRPPQAALLMGVVIS